MSFAQYMTKSIARTGIGTLDLLLFDTNNFLLMCLLINSDIIYEQYKRDRRHKEQFQIAQAQVKK